MIGEANGLPDRKAVWRSYAKKEEDAVQNKGFPYIRCLFCKTGAQRNAVRQIEESGLGMALHPQKVEPFYRNGVWRDVQKPLLPGYVFVYAQESYPAWKLLKIDGVIRLLTYGEEDSDGYLNGKDGRFAEWLLGNDGLVEKLEAIREGSYVRIVDGLLKDYNGKVIKVNKQQHMAYLSLDMVGAIHYIWLGFQFIEEKTLGPSSADDKKTE
ncbi:MAG: hypothetical protein MR842_01660 [Clostridiales bacterium]|nr:hypothetical protein [Clostridiales bacterium]